jgi:hypothetical protein
LPRDLFPADCDAAPLSGLGRHPLLNLFLGWTLIGWVAALVWSVMPIKPERRLTLIEQALIERRIADELRI